MKIKLEDNLIHKKPRRMLKTDWPSILLQKKIKRKKNQKDRSSILLLKRRKSQKEKTGTALKGRNSRAESTNTPQTQLFLNKLQSKETMTTTVSQNSNLTRKEPRIRELKEKNLTTQIQAKNTI